MVPDRIPEHLAERLERICQHWETRRTALFDPGKKAAPPRAFTIALARETETKGTLIAHEVGKELGWQVYDHELLERLAKDMGLRANLLESVDERRQSWITEAFEAFMSASVENAQDPLVSESAYVRHLVQTVLALGAHGDCVIVGRGAEFILPADTTLRVRLIAPLNQRITALGQKLGISRPEAVRRLTTIDRQRLDFVQSHFFKDPSDARNYDLVLNASRFSAAATAAIIVDTFRRFEVEGRYMHERQTPAAAGTELATT